MSNTMVIKAAVVAPVALVLSVVGWSGWLIAVLAVMMAADYLTGSAAAIKRGEWSSAVAREGLWHKAGMLAAVLVAIALDVTAAIVLQHVPAVDFGGAYKAAVLPVVCVWYILTEFGSILENAGALGAPIPAILRKAIAALKGKVDEDDGGEE